MKKTLSIFIFFLFVLIISRAENIKFDSEAIWQGTEEIIENKYGIKLSEMPSKICGNSGILERMTIDYSQLSVKERKKIIDWENKLKDEQGHRNIISSYVFIKNQELNQDIEFYNNNNWSDFSVRRGSEIFDKEDYRCWLNARINKINKMFFMVQACDKKYGPIYVIMNELENFTSTFSGNHSWKDGVWPIMRTFNEALSEGSIMFYISRKIASNILLSFLGFFIIIILKRIILKRFI